MNDEWENDYAKGFFAGQAALKNTGTLVILDSPKITNLENALISLKNETKQDRELLNEAYKAMLVLHTMLDKYGFALGTAKARKICEKIQNAHPEFLNDKSGI